VHGARGSGTVEGSLRALIKGLTFFSSTVGIPSTSGPCCAAGCCPPRTDRILTFLLFAGSRVWATLQLPLIRLMRRSTVQSLIYLLSFRRFTHQSNLN
jgi:hypothetical protein